MRKLLAVFVTMLVVIAGSSLIFFTPMPVAAIGEVTPTPAPVETMEPDSDFDVDAVIDEAIADIQNGDFQAALTKMDAVIAAAPDRMTAYLIRGVAQTQLGLIDDAIDDFTVAIELAPWELQLFVFRGDAYLRDNALTDALLDYDQAIRINPFAADAYLRRAEVNYDLGDTVAGDVDDLIARALSANTSGDTPSALAFLDEAISTGEGLMSIAPAHYIRAIINQNLGDRDATLDDYASALEADPDLHNVYLARGIFYREDDKIQIAGENFFNRITTHAAETIDETMAIGEALEVEMAYRRAYAITFEGEAGQVITISADDAPTTVTDPLIAFLNPDGEPIAGDDDFGGLSTGTFNSLIEDFELPEDGTYTLLLSHAEGGYDFGFNGIVTVEISE